jgi:hypothetical protein
MRNGGDGGQEPNAYWRRRVITLVIGLGLLGLLAWAFSGAGSGKAPHQSTGLPQSMGGALPAAAYGSPSAGFSGAPSPSGTAASPSAGASASPESSSTPTASPSASPTATPTHGAKTRNAKTPNAKGHSQARAASASGRGGRCAAADVVVSLFVTKDSYRPRELPQFDIDAVSTASGKCAFDLGPRTLRLSVTSRSHVVWASDECLRGAGSKVTELTRGVPAEVSVTWDRAVSASGCGSRHASARPGGYSAVVSNGMVASQQRTFHLK